MKRRMIDSSIWSNENFAALPLRGRLLQIGMINIADDQGRLKAHPLYLAKEIFPYDHTEAIDVSKWLDQMVENGTIRVYAAEGKQYAQFLNWWEYQSLQFAHPSIYPRPDSWQDRIRFNGKGNQMMIANWQTPKGERMQDTCDQDGKPFPFVMELPATKVPAQVAPNVPAEVGTQAPTQAPTQVGTQVGTLAPAEVATNVATQAPAEVPTQVTSQLLNFSTTNLTKEEKGESNSNGAKAPALTSSSKEHLLIKAYHELHNRYPSRAQMTIIIERDPPIAGWIRAIRAWAAAGHKPTNIQGMLDWAFDPSRYEDHHAAPSGHPGSNEPARKTGYSDYNHLLPKEGATP